MVTVLAPMTGWVSPLGDVPDPVFAGKIMGDGVAIEPTEPRVVAPCDGKIATLAGHAFTLRPACGADILVHVGLETVALKGRGFKALVHEGEAIKAGDTVFELDLDFLARNAKSLITPVIVAGEGFRVTRSCENREVSAGGFLMEIESVAAAALSPVSGGRVSGRAIVACAHGLHARPSALVAGAAKRFDGEVTLTCRGKSANAKSATAIMALGTRQGDDVVIAAPNRAAVDAIAAVLAAVGERDHAALEPVAPTKSLPSNTATRIYGIPAASGRCVGVAVPLRRSELSVLDDGRGIAAETEALRAALATLRARMEIEAVNGARARRSILSAHIALLDDPDLLAAAEKKITEGKSAAAAWKYAIGAMVETLRAMEDPRQRERASDLLDIERQLVTLLIGAAAEPERAFPPEAILIAEEILPSDLKPGIAGFVSAGGGATSHAAILAAGMGIPALVGMGDTVFSVTEGAVILLDADAGLLDLKPAASQVTEVRQRLAADAVRQARERTDAQADCVTADGMRVEVFANLGNGASEAADAVALGAEGCGVLRTEFLFMDRDTPPSEDEQFAVYQAIADALIGRPFVIRTFDIGADKPVPYLQFPPEDNPQLGLRGIRASGVWPDLLNTQLKAAARVRGNVKVMLPMVVAAEEIRAVRAHLAATGITLRLGAMVETPAAAMTADLIAAEADFFSIGTNDLTQYTLAIDRGHRALSAKLDALHPAVLRLIARTAEAANAGGKPVAICGGLAADPLAAPILIGLGISELSVPPPVIPRLKANIRTFHVSACRAVAQTALTLETPEAVRSLMKAKFGAQEDHQ